MKESKRKSKEQMKDVFWSVEKPDGSVVMGGNLDLDVSTLKNAKEKLSTLSDPDGNRADLQHPNGDKLSDRLSEFMAKPENQMMAKFYERFIKEQEWAYNEGVKDTLEKLNAQG